MTKLLSPILAGHGNDHVSFWCPGCEDFHTIPVKGANAWGYNDNPASPTFTPSILCTHKAVPDAAEEFKEWRTARVCHSFVTDGRIQFLGDCTHALAGQTVDLPNYPINNEGDVE